MILTVHLIGNTHTQLICECVNTVLPAYFKGKKNGKNPELYWVGLLSTLASVK